MIRKLLLSAVLLNATTAFAVKQVEINLGVDTQKNIIATTLTCFFGGTWPHLEKLRDELLTAENNGNSADFAQLYSAVQANQNLRSGAANGNQQQCLVTMIREKLRGTRNAYTEMVRILDPSLREYLRKECTPPEGDQSQTLEKINSPYCQWKALTGVRETATAIRNKVRKAKNVTSLAQIYSNLQDTDEVIFNYVKSECPSFGSVCFTERINELYEESRRSERKMATAYGRLSYASYGAKACRQISFAPCLSEENVSDSSLTAVNPNRWLQVSTLPQYERKIPPSADARRSIEQERQNTNAPSSNVNFGATGEIITLEQMIERSCSPDQLDSAETNAAIERSSYASLGNAGLGFSAMSKLMKLFNRFMGESKIFLCQTLKTDPDNQSALFLAQLANEIAEIGMKNVTKKASIEELILVSGPETFNRTKENIATLLNEVSTPGKTELKNLIAFLDGIEKSEQTESIDVDQNQIINDAQRTLMTFMFTGKGPVSGTSLHEYLGVIKANTQGNYRSNLENSLCPWILKLNESQRLKGGDAADLFEKFPTTLARCFV